MNRVVIVGASVRVHCPVRICSDRLPLRSRADIDALNLDLHLGVAGAGRTVALSDGDPVPYEAVVVATGVRPRHLPGTEGVAGMHTLTSPRPNARRAVRPGANGYGGVMWMVA
ncbi:hypothetical protein [Nonomuraea jabiensis]|uniref:FAD/NAD(P)-binding domain-containing protein n=1 Tax=Nonomuraea jabiensis TaxID=882448 RepID=A0A7W9GE45_9ACTN|nr:hypothetical protein [Nonomuraea jabiensis]MBB5782154.1 hypothetical protein [Nonomuraea jabiensis]